MAPMSAWQILQGIETLPVRMERHVANTRKVVGFCGRTVRRRIHHPELPEHRDHELAKKCFPKGTTAVFSFDLKGTRAQGKVHRQPAPVLASRQRRREIAGYSSGQHHAFAHERRRARQGWHHRARSACRSGWRDAKDLIDDLARALKAAEKVGNAK